MIELPKVKRWTGDGFGNTEARILTQLKCTEKVALYHRTVEKTGTDEGYEVFLIKIRHKGDPLPGGLFEKEDRLVYPSCGSFGKSAWHILSLKLAKEKFDELQNKADGIINDDTDDAPTTPKEKIASVIGEFTVAQYAEKKGLSYPNGYVALKAEIANGSVKFVRSVRMNAKGKATNLYVQKS